MPLRIVRKDRGGGMSDAERRALDKRIASLEARLEEVSDVTWV